MITVKSIVETCEACPSQFDGLTTDNRKLYFRYRWAHLSVQIGAQDDMSEMAAVRGEYLVQHKQISDNEYDGYMSLEELKEHTKDILHWNEPLEEYVPPDELKLMKELFGEDKS
jgi:hypothetical protein